MSRDEALDTMTLDGDTDIGHVVVASIAANVAP